MKLRLLITDKCDRSCEGCCNKQWDLQSLPVAGGFSKYDMIMLTGGEPMLFPSIIKSVVREIRVTNKDAPIIVYTAKVDEIDGFFDVYYHVDGFTVTLHEQKDVEPWYYIRQLILLNEKPMSLRLNVFKGVELGDCDTTGWIVKRDIDWIEDCPLPEDEEFMRYT